MLYSAELRAILLGGFRQPRFQYGFGIFYREHGTRRAPQSVVVLISQIQQALLDEWIRLFSEAPAAISLRFQKRLVHTAINNPNSNAVLHRERRTLALTISGVEYHLVLRVIGETTRFQYRARKVIGDAIVIVVGFHRRR
jgi:hypothetical protein